MSGDHDRNVQEDDLAVFGKVDPETRTELPFELVCSIPRLPHSRPFVPSAPKNSEQRTETEKPAAWNRIPSIDARQTFLKIKIFMPTQRATSQDIIALEVIERRIYLTRGHRVVLDSEPYGVEPRAVLPLRSQNVILERGQHSKYVPHLFTEHGVVMPPNVLKSPRAVRASIQVVGAFVHLRRALATNQELEASQFSTARSARGA